MRVGVCVPDHPDPASENDVPPEHPPEIGLNLRILLAPIGCSAIDMQCVVGLRDREGPRCLHYPRAFLVAEHCCPNKVRTINHNLLFLNQNHWFSTGHRLERHEAYATIAYSLSEGMVMYSGQFVFSQVMEHLPMKTFRKCVQRYQGDRRVQSFTCFDQFLCMAFAQLTYRESLRDIEACLRAHKDKLYHMGIRGGMSRNTLANANQRRDWRIYAEFAQAMIRIARPLYADEDLGLDLDNTVYALDASTIDLCLSVFPWALFRSTKSAVKLHTLLDLRGNIPTFIHVSDGKMHDVNVLDILIPEPGAFYIMDRGYLDFERLFLLHSIGAFFIIRAKSNTRYERRYSHSIDKATGVRCDQTVVLTGAKGKKHYPQPIRRIKYYDENTQKSFNFLTNHFAVPALTVTELYRYRWQVELFFKWIKQHLRIKSFFGTSENAVKSQIWIAVTVYVLVAVIRKRLGISADLYTILQVLSLTLFEKMPLFKLFSEVNSNLSNFNPSNQLILFE